MLVADTPITQNCDTGAFAGRVSILNKFVGQF